MIERTAIITTDKDEFEDVQEALFLRYPLSTWVSGKTSILHVGDEEKLVLFVSPMKASAQAGNDNYKLTFEWGRIGDINGKYDNSVYVIDFRVFPIKRVSVDEWEHPRT